MSAPAPPTLLSVVVTVLEGGATLQTMLEALTHQTDAPPLQIIVPYDDTLADLHEVTALFPAVELVALGHVTTRHPLPSPAGEHELYDRRRAAGLAHARGEVVAMLEDRCIPRADWAATAVRLHAQLPAAVIGGAVECGSDDATSWAIYFCDFGRYQPPFAAGPAQYVTDINVTYKRSALAATRALWQERYHETTVHWALLARGETLQLSPELVVSHVRNKHVPLRQAVVERFHWGRLFAYTRARACSTPERLRHLGLSPLLPLALFTRHGVRQLRKHRNLREFARAAPLMLAMLVPWSLGEAWGYATREP